ncbi:MAG TPA: sensor domain-containing diguanylate cyclase [Gammaproteobacteria bacterium]
MAARKTNLLTYSSLLAGTGWLLLAWATLAHGVTLAHPVDVGVFVILTVFIISGGFTGPFVGHTSLDRVAQVASVLVFGAIVGAWINAIASFIWPFVDRKHNRGNFTFLLTRGLHSSGMSSIMVLAAGLAYENLGGPVPLTHLDTSNIVLIAMMALLMQLINEALMSVYAQLNQGDFRKSLSLFASLLELAAVPLGVFTALVYNVATIDMLVLYLGLLILLMMIVRRFAENHWALAERVDELLVINRIGRGISSSLILDDLAELVFEQCRKLLNFSAFYLVLYDEEAGELDFRLHHNEEGRQPRKRKKLGEGALGWIIENNQAFLIANWKRSEHPAKTRAVIVGETPSSLIGVPVSYGNRVLGAISIQSFSADEFDEADLNLLMTLSDQVAVAIANAQLFTELQEYKDQLERRVEERTREIEAQKESLVALSDSLREASAQKELLLRELQRKTDELDRQTKEDSLTGLYNRRFMDERLTEEFRRAERFGHAVSIAMLDIDEFKHINDTFSHMLADDVLRIVAKILKSQCRGIDVISRYGGDEFLLCFPETPTASAKKVCEKIREAVESYDWKTLDPKLVVTASIGVSGLAPGGGEKQTLMVADAKLYEAKRAGRNLVCG